MHMATRTRRWTLAEVHSLPDDGNRYELVDGELLVTPPPSEAHETVLARLHRLLEPYVERHHLGMVYRPRAVVRAAGSEVEPDLMVRRARRVPRGDDWNEAPIPLLVVEALSPGTRQRDLGRRRRWYRKIGVGEYWILDVPRRTIRVVRRSARDVVVNDVARWHPSAAAVAFELDVPGLFADLEE